MGLSVSRTNEQPGKERLPGIDAGMTLDSSFNTIRSITAQLETVEGEYWLTCSSSNLPLVSTASMVASVDGKADPSLPAL